MNTDLKLQRFATKENALFALNSLLISGTFFLLFLDSVGYQYKTFKLFGFYSYHLVPYVLLIQFLLRYCKNIRITKPLTTLFYGLLLPVITLTAVVISIIEAYVSVNAVYAATRLQQEQLSLVAIFLAISCLLNQKTEWWRTQWQKVLIVVPYVCILIAGIIRLWPFDLFKHFVKEANFVENQQALHLIIGALVCGYISFRYFKQKQLKTAAFMLLIAIGFGLVGGDELSWGQRILKFETPIEYAELNRQEETTFHNLYAVEWLVELGYIVVAGVGIFGRSIISVLPLPKFLKKANLVSWFPDWRFAGYFIFTFIYYARTRWIGGTLWPEWSEVMELYLYTGLVLWFIYRGYIGLGSKSST